MIADASTSPFGSVGAPSRRIVMASGHLAVSALVAAVAWLVVFQLWFPGLFSEIAGGTGLFWLVITVDVMLGPLLTAVVASPRKSIKQLKIDIGCIAAVQLLALAFGLYTLALARPVAVAFEVDRMRVVTAADIEPASLMQAPEALRALSWTGPRVIAAVKPTDPNQAVRAIELGLAGIDLAMLPSQWRAYEEQREQVRKASRPVDELITKYPQAAAAVGALTRQAGVQANEVRFLPLMSRQASWVTLVAGPESRIIGHLPFDGFF